MGTYVHLLVYVVLTIAAVYCLARVAAMAVFAEKFAYMKRVAKELH